MSQTLDIIVFRSLCVSCIQVFCDVQYDFKVSENDTKSCFTGVLVGWHFSGGGSILLALHQIPLQPDQLSPKCLADHPTSPTTVGNVQTAIAIRKMDACVSPEDVSNTRNNSVSSTVCMSCIQVCCDVQYDFKVSENDTKSCFTGVLVHGRIRSMVESEQWPLHVHGHSSVSHRSRLTDATHHRS